MSVLFSAVHFDIVTVIEVAFIFFQWNTRINFEEPFVWGSN